MTTRLFIRAHTNKQTKQQQQRKKYLYDKRRAKCKTTFIFSPCYETKKKMKKMNHNHAHKIQKSLLCNDCNHSHGVIVAAPLFFPSTSTAENKEKNFFHFLCGIVPPEGVLRRSKRRRKCFQLSSYKTLYKVGGTAAVDSLVDGIKVVFFFHFQLLLV